LRAPDQFFKRAWNHQYQPLETPSRPRILLSLWQRSSRRFADLFLTKPLEYADRFELLVDVPGVDPKQVEITLDNGVLTLSSAAAQRALVLGRPAPVSWGREATQLAPANYDYSRSTANNRIDPKFMD
jgi:hypothetical protein